VPVDTTGSCLCGAVKFSFEGQPTVFQYCHCSRCRKRSGSAHAANLFVPAESFRWLAGEDQVRRFELPSAVSFCSGFCATCGGALPWRTRNGQRFIIPAGSLDEDPGVKPDRNIHFGSRAPWYVAAADLPAFDAGSTGSGAASR
jgi:hypothetical protein